MAGTIKVENITGPTSGVNANKIIIPAGQTLVVNGASEGLGGGFTYAAVTGATHDLDYANGNFFDAGTLTANTTVTFSNLETQSNWRYKFTPNVISGQWDIIKSSFLRSSIAVTDYSSVPQGLFFKPDGSKVYTIGWSSDEVHEYNLTDAWNLRSLTYVQSFDVSGQDTAPYGVFFKDDGTKMYVAGDSLNNVYEYALSTAWDISTATYTHFIDIYASDAAIRDIYFKPDGTKFYFPGNVNDSIYQWSMSTAWDVSTATAESSFSVSSQTTEPNAVFFKDDGTKMFVLDKVNRYVLQYTLSTAWDISTASYDGDSTGRFQVNVQELSPEGMFFKDDGSRMFIIGSSGDDINEYSVGDFSTLTLPSAVSNTPNLTDTVVDNVYCYEFFTTDGGTTVDVISEEIL